MTSDKSTNSYLTVPQDKLLILSLIPEHVNPRLKRSMSCPLHTKVYMTIMFPTDG